MVHKVELSQPAKRDLQDVIKYVSADNPEIAERFGRFLLSKTKALAQFPEMGRAVPEFRDSSVREIIVRSYRVIYRLDRAKRIVEIIRFWHAARGIPQL